MARALASSFVRKGTKRTVVVKWDSKDIKPIARVHIEYSKDGDLLIYKGFGKFDENYWELIHQSKIVKTNFKGSKQ